MEVLATIPSYICMSSCFDMTAYSISLILFVPELGVAIIELWLLIHALLIID